MIKDKDFKYKTAISASRLDTFLNCSSLYAAKYIYKLPDNGNLGSKRGSVTHDILEILHNKRHFSKVQKVLAEKTCKNIPSLWKLVCAYAKKYEIKESEDLDQIDRFIHTALNTDFYGPLDTVEIFSEKKFDFEVEDNGIGYRLSGFIDRSFVYRKGNNLYVKIMDWKTSKQIFDKEKLAVNTQAICYQIAAQRYLFPELKLTGFDFIFLKFPKKPVVAVELKDDGFLCGYELWLTDIQQRIENFTESNANDNFAALDAKNKWLCGKEGNKKDNSPNWICPARNPLNYYVLLDKNQKIIKSSFSNDLIAKEDEKVEYRQYSGCSYFYTSEGKRRGLSY